VLQTEKNNLSSLALEASCITYPYDNSEDECNLYGWQKFVNESLTHTKKEHDMALLEIEKDLENDYKRLILLSHYYENINIRAQATDDMIKVSQENLNSFGQFLSILATYNQRDIDHQRSRLTLQARLKKSAKKNANLKSELNQTQLKIQAIMDIEKNLSTN